MTTADDAYLSFGGAPEGHAVEAQATLDYLRGLGFGHGYLEAARTAAADAQQRRFHFEPLNANYCDFCFTKLMGGEFDRLRDGRERCVRCSRTVVRTSAEFAELFSDTRRNFETVLGVTLHVGIAVHMVNARTIARRTGEVFQPTRGSTRACLDLPLRPMEASRSISRTALRSSRRSRPSPTN